MMILGRKIKSRQGKAVAYNSSSTLALEYAIQIRILIQDIYYWGNCSFGISIKGVEKIVAIQICVNLAVL